MKSVFKKIVPAIGVVIIGLVTLAALKSPNYRIEREISIKAPAEAIFPIINSVSKTNEWMPWKESDPQMTLSYSGPDSGVGATTSWDSPGQMGHGKAEVIESVVNSKVVTKITYAKPMQMEQMSEFSLVQTGDSTTMRWSTWGQNGFVGRFFCLFMNMDKMVGGEFEKGLKKLKTMVEEGRQ